jgi:uncharacterized protein YjdB
VVTGRARGMARIRALSGSRADTAMVQVRQIVASVQTTPATDTLITGGDGRLTATAADSGGAAVPDAPFQWSSSATAVATVDGQGRVHALAPGTARISATSQGVAGSTTVVVRPVPIHSILLSASRLNLGVGTSHQLVATAQDAAGNPLTGRTFAWGSTDPGVATVSPAGLVTAVSPGSAEITVEAEGQSSTAYVQVPNRRTR